MSGIVRWNPSSSLLHRNFGPSFGRLIEEFFSVPERREEGVSDSTWAPTADVKETDEALFVYVELPGLHKEDVHVSLESNVLTVSGERRFTKDDTKENYHRVERFYGKFSRSFRLPRNVDAEKVNANFADGLLTLELPKAPEARSRQIEIN